MPNRVWTVWNFVYLGQVHWQSEKNPEESGESIAPYITSPLGGPHSRLDFRFLLRSYLFTTFDFFSFFLFPALCLLNDFLLFFSSHFGFFFFFFLEKVGEWGLCNGLFFYCCFDCRCLRHLGIIMLVFCCFSTLDSFVNRIWPAKREGQKKLSINGI